MSVMHGDLLTKTRKLVKGLAKAKPLWFKAMEHYQAPPVTFPRTERKVDAITLPEDIYIKKFFQKHPDSKYEDAISGHLLSVHRALVHVEKRFSGFDPPPARVFGWRLLELKEQGVSEEGAIAVADMEYQAEKKAKKKAYVQLKQIARLQGKKPSPIPYPSAVKEIQAEERKFVHERFTNSNILEIMKKMKEEKAIELQERWRGGGGW